MSRNDRAQPLVKMIIKKIIEDEDIKLFKDQNNEAYISPTGDGREVYDLDYREAQEWLSGYVMDEFDNEVLLRDQPKTVLETLRGYAQHRGARIPLELRTAFDDGGNLWYDLGKSAVCITPDGWKIDPYPPILFVRNYTQRPQVLPKTGGTIWELFDFVNVKSNEDKLLLIAFLTAALVPEINKPILALSGPAGSGKSECTKTLKNLMDPTVPPSLPPISGTMELDNLAQTSAVMAFDNLTTMNQATANHFCSLATGYGVRIRKLYTNRFIIFEAIRPLIVNGISQVITQPDLLTRAIPIELSPIEKRIEDSELRKKFDEASPRILGAMFDLLSKALKICPTIKDRNWPRMGSFVKWGCAITAALGEGYTSETFMKAFAKVEGLQHSEALNANPFADVITWFMRNKEAWSGTADELIEVLTSVSQDGDSENPDIKYCSQSSYWPSNPRAARVQIQKSLGDLKSTGIIACLPSGSNRTIHLINSKLPLNNALRKAFYSPSPYDINYAEQGYDVNDFVSCYAGMVSPEHVKCISNKEAVLEDAVLSGRIIPKITSGTDTTLAKPGNMADFIEKTIMYKLPKTKKRLEVEAKAKAEKNKLDEEEKRKKEKLEEERQKRDKEKRQEQAKKKAEAAKRKAEYIAQCEKYGMPIDQDYLEYIEVGGLWGSAPF